MTFRYTRSYRGPIKAVVFDWAGTLIDYGSRAPVAAFIETFRQQGLIVSDELVRVPMGAHKRDHIRAILRMPQVEQLFVERNGKVFDETLVEKMYAEFLPVQLRSLAEHSDPIPGAIAVIDALKNQGIKIGSTTGYSREIMEVVIAQSKEKGLQVDSMVCASDVQYSRPAPWMCLENAQRFNIFPMEAIIKVGDTISDIEEGLNAGMWSVGVAQSGNELGLSKAQVDSLSHGELKMRLGGAYERMYAAGAHFVIDTVADLPDLIHTIHNRLQVGERP